ncbi:hypothetical protein E3P92_01606 [Wallemia ichthyophaga]|nr:hypothetical protein E3P91_01444 [Wallemia ichthyophaga]TIB15550.1 hypothetical protein E3P92_01606 [Wallemia ichthyophaga]TIB30894.1 hypothetical protein E3P84_03164 [Wallemia ichthyophaga]TIB40146.1 hypothetical protein E3P83_03107 [Wallemia ichthyophaga]TIB63871.1 hypothetical protein E3P78_01524 [Wallemia ichthyophaga]
MKPCQVIHLNKHEKLIKKSILAKTNKSQAPTHSPQQQEKIKHSRIIKAERDERLDIGQSLSPPKHYMGGSYEFKSPYEPPREDSFVPHEVVLFRTRWNIDKGIGIPNAPDHFVGVYPLSHIPSTILNLHKFSLGVDQSEAKDRKFWNLWQNTYPDKSQKDVIDVSDNISSDDDFYVGFRTLPLQTNDRISGSLFKEEEIGGSRSTKQADGSYLPSTIPPTPYFAPLDILPKADNADNPLSLPPATIIYPLIRIILPTRSLARVFGRLSRSLVTGMPYIGVIPLADRKDGKSVFRRVTRLRLSRMRALLRDTTSRLEGFHGGFPGLRVTHKDRGRGWRGERLDEGFPNEFKQVKVLMRPGLLPLNEVADWELLPNVTVRSMDDLGRELSDDLSEVVESSQMLAQDANQEGFDEQHENDHDEEHE